MDDEQQLKCADLRRRLHETEQHNEVMLVTIERTRRMIQRARLERAILLERLEHISTAGREPETEDTPPPSPIVSAGSSARGTKRQGSAPPHDATPGLASAAPASSSGPKRRRTPAATKNSEVHGTQNQRNTKRTDVTAHSGHSEGSGDGSAEGSAEPNPGNTKGNGDSSTKNTPKVPAVPPRRATKEQRLAYARDIAALDPEGLSPDQVRRRDKALQALQSAEESDGLRLETELQGLSDGEGEGENEDENDQQPGRKTGSRSEAGHQHHGTADPESEESGHAMPSESEPPSEAAEPLSEPPEGFSEPQSEAMSEPDA